VIEGAGLFTQTARAEIKTILIEMIYFENYLYGTSGLNNHILPYTLCISLSNFLDRDFYFDFEAPSNFPPDFALTGPFKDKFKILMNSRRSLVSDLLVIPNRRIHFIDRNIENKTYIPDQQRVFMTTLRHINSYNGTSFINFFGIGRTPLIREELQEFDLIEFGDNGLVNPSFFYFLDRAEKTELLESVKILFSDDIESLAARISRELGMYNAIHLRLGDFLTSYESDGFRIDRGLFKNYLTATFKDTNIPIAVATDGLNEKELFADVLEGFPYFFIDELIFDSFIEDFRALEFTDFNVLSILNQLICAAAETFVGTLRSTFTVIIHRLRQERYRKKDFNFVPDARIQRLLTEDYKIAADSHGFFDWNRYSIFTEHYAHPSWMREWDFDLTTFA
jgi:hypothetical protein